MRIIPVLDLLGGLAVHARGGIRASYAPLSSQLAPSVSGDAQAVACAYRDRLGLRELYLADLDAIAGGVPQRGLRRALATELGGGAVWLDAGVATMEQAREVAEDGATRVVVGLETLPAECDPRALLREITVGIRPTGPNASGQPHAHREHRTGAARADGALPASSPDTDSGVRASRPDDTETRASPRAVFSLDLRAGRPETDNPVLRALTPIAIAELAAECGMDAIIALDLARVGMGTGPDIELVRALRLALPRVELVAGGGSRDAADFQRLADAGADAALVGSALHYGSADQGSIRGLLVTPLPDVTSPPPDD